MHTEKEGKKESKSARMADKDDRYCAKNPNPLKTLHSMSREYEVYLVHEMRVTFGKRKMCTDVWP